MGLTPYRAQRLLWLAAATSVFRLAVAAQRDWWQQLWVSAASDCSSEVCACHRTACKIARLSTRSQMLLAVPVLGLAHLETQPFPAPAVQASALQVCASSNLHQGAMIPELHTERDLQWLLRVLSSTCDS